MEEVKTDDQITTESDPVVDSEIKNRIIPEAKAEENKPTLNSVEPFFNVRRFAPRTSFIVSRNEKPIEPIKKPSSAPLKKQPLLKKDNKLPLEKPKTVIDLTKFEDNIDKFEQFLLFSKLAEEKERTRVITRSEPVKLEPLFEPKKTTTKIQTQFSSRKRNFDSDGDEQFFKTRKYEDYEDTKSVTKPSSRRDFKKWLL